MSWGVISVLRDKGQWRIDRAWSQMFAALKGLEPLIRAQRFLQNAKPTFSLWEKDSEWKASIPSPSPMGRRCPKGG